MAGERVVRILALLSAAQSDGSAARHLCAVAAEVTGMTGAAILLFDETVLRGQVCSSDSVAKLTADLQFALGEGPGVDAHNQGLVVAEPDLNEPVQSRWAAFAPAAIAGGACAIFAFPVRIGVARLGALCLYRDHHGPLTDDQYQDASVMASVAARAILSMQADAPSDAVAAEVLAEGDFHFNVHQAAGMISVQLAISVSQALVVLRAHAFRVDRLLADVAADVVNRTKRFDEADRA